MEAAQTLILQLFLLAARSPSGPRVLTPHAAAAWERAMERVHGTAEEHALRKALVTHVTGLLAPMDSVLASMDTVRQCCIEYDVICIVSS